MIYEFSNLIKDIVLVMLDRGQLGTGIVRLCASLNVTRISVTVS